MEISLNDHNLNEFGQSVTMDFAPEGSVCEWCGKPAMEQLTVIGGKRHNEGGYYCHACGEKFIQTVADAKSGQDSASAPAQHPYSSCPYILCICISINCKCLYYYRISARIARILR